MTDPLLTKGLVGVGWSEYGGRIWSCVGTAFGMEDDGRGEFVGVF